MRTLRPQAARFERDADPIRRIADEIALMLRGRRRVEASEADRNRLSPSAAFTAGPPRIPENGSAPLRRIGARGGARAARPSLVGERDGQPRMQSFRREGLLHLAVELAFDDHVNEP